jgi:hypothetical protein
MSDPTPANSFHLFALLPKELRLQIWNSALENRVIPLYRINDSVKGRGILYPMRIAIAGFMALTRSHPSLETFRRVCPEAKAVCDRRFMVLEVWDARKMGFGTPYDPLQDILFFTHSIDASILLDFATLHPMEATRLHTIALPSLITSERVSRRETLAALHAFDNLEEVIIVVGNAPNETTVSWLGAIGKDPWVLPHSAEETLAQLRMDRWPDWKLPTVTLVLCQEDIRNGERIASWIED